MRTGLTIREVAMLLGIRLGSVYSLVWGGTLKAAKADGEWVVDRESVEAYQAQRSARRERIRRSQQSRSAKVIEVRSTTAASDVLTTATDGATRRAL